MKGSGWVELLKKYGESTPSSENGNSCLLGMWNSLVGPKNFVVLLWQHSTVDQLIGCRSDLDHQSSSMSINLNFCSVQ